MIQPYLPPAYEEINRLSKIEMLFSEMDAIYREYAEKHHFPGYAYGIVLDGRLVHVGSGGFSDVEKRVPATSRSMFRIASMTKSFTAIAILKLRDEKKLRLDDPVSLYIPEVKDLKLSADQSEMTIRDLLTHSAGFPTDDPWADRKMEEGEEKFLELLKGGLFFACPSGTTFEYSNLGFAMLGYIVKQLTGLFCSDFINQTICEPIGMKEATWDFTTVLDSQLSRGYSWVEGSWKEEPLLRDGVFGAMGGFITSVESFSKYMAIYQSAWPPRDDPEIGPIKRSSLREMQQPWRFRELFAEFTFDEGRNMAVTTGYGYGLSWFCDADNRVFVGHSGGLPGFGCNWLILPEYGLGVVLLANLTYAPAPQVNFTVLDRLIVKSQLKPLQQAPSKFLQEGQSFLLQNLPNWEKTKTHFAPNFFLDLPVEIWKKETRISFAKIGNVLCVDPVVPETQLRGHFLIKGEKGDLKITFGLTPENPPQIQHCEIKVADGK